VANLFAVVGIMCAALLIVACWLEARGRARYSDVDRPRSRDAGAPGRRAR
jgi:hypothetical protein